VALPKLGCEQQQQQQQQRLVRSPGRCCGEQQPACVGEGGKTQRLLVEERGPRETQKPRHDLADDKDELALVNIGGYSPLAGKQQEKSISLLLGTVYNNLINFMKYTETPLCCFVHSPAASQELHCSEWPCVMKHVDFDFTFH